MAILLGKSSEFLDSTLSYNQKSLWCFLKKKLKASVSNTERRLYLLQIENSYPKLSPVSDITMDPLS
jgi:hypothetical protein